MWAGVRDMLGVPWNPNSFAGFASFLEHLSHKARAMFSLFLLPSLGPCGLLETT
jgi:hypothetical protein